MLAFSWLPRSAQDPPTLFWAGGCLGEVGVQVAACLGEPSLNCVSLCVQSFLAAKNIFRP